MLSWERYFWAFLGSTPDFAAMNPTRHRQMVWSVAEKVRKARLRYEIESDMVKTSEV